MTELRRPKHVYQGRNGFTESTSASENGVISESSRLAVEARKRRLAEWVLQQKGTHFPDLEKIKSLNAELETTFTIKRRIDELKMQHAKDTESLYAYYAQVYRQEQEELRAACDDSPVSEDPAFLAERAALEELYSNNRLSIKYQLECDDAVARIRYSHIQTLLLLQKKLAILSAQFPESIGAYHAMSNNQDMQLKVARFLMSPSNMRDAMLSDFGWAWRQVKPLLDEFERDIDFRAEVQKYVKENEMRDPRKRSSMLMSL